MSGRHAMRLLVSAQLAAEFGERLQREAPDVTPIWLDDNGEAHESTADAEILFRSYVMKSNALVTALQNAPRLRWLHTASAGVEKILPAFVAYAPPDAVLTNGSGAMSRPIAEYCLAQIFATSKTLPFYTHAQERHEWVGNNAAPALDLLGARVLVLGLGSIGTTVAQLCGAVGMRVWAVRRRPPAPAERFPGVEHVYGVTEEWRSLLPQMDYVIISMPLTDLTHELVGAAELAQMKATAWLINISRGAIIDEEALIAALRSRQVGGAVLDVTTTEPLPPDHPLWDCPNAIITPHISWRSPQTNIRSADIFMENLRRYRSGEPLSNLVPRDQGY